MELRWNVLKVDFNSKEIKGFNVFHHTRFAKDVKMALKKFDDKEEFAADVRRNLMYYYWSKCEYEVVVTDFPPCITMDELKRINIEREKTKEEYGREPHRINVSHEIGSKINIYDQVMLNFDAFIDYIWSHKKQKHTKKDYETVPCEGQISLFDYEK